MRSFLASQGCDTVVGLRGKGTAAADKAKPWPCGRPGSRLAREYRKTRTAARQSRGWEERSAHAVSKFPWAVAADKVSRAARLR